MLATLGNALNSNTYSIGEGRADIINKNELRVIVAAPIAFHIENFRHVMIFYIATVLMQTGS